MQFLLASASPRRSELFKMITPDFTIAPVPVDETLPEGLAGGPAAEALATRKAAEAALSHPEHVVIGADTIVAVDGILLGKPQDHDDAFVMLSMLSGREHHVHTGVAVFHQGFRDSFFITSRVAFYPLDADEINRYIETGEPADKAGAYGIQGRGGLFVREIQGDYYNIVGLPVAPLYWHLKRLGIPL